MPVPGNIPIFFRLIACSMALLGLTACGGGGGGDSSPPVAPPAPVLSLSPESIKTFSFSWADVSGETGYRLLENPDGSAGYSEVASIAANATSHELEVFLPGRINASYILEACNSAGCSESNAVFVSGTLAEAVGYFKASNTATFYRFGSAIVLAADGNTLAVGSSGESSNATGINGDESNTQAADSGAVYVFSRSGGSWAQQAYIKASNTSAGDWFGISIALSDTGNTLAVGAWWEDSDATGIDGDQHNDEATDSGAVYVFSRSADTWSQQAYVKASNTGAGDHFGHAVALSGDGDTLAVGAYYEDSTATGIDGDQENDDLLRSGAVYVYTRGGDTWSQQAYVKAANAGILAEFGYSVALSGDGDTLAVGALRENSVVPGSGAVYVFSRSADTWSQQAFLKASSPGGFDQLGYSVALSGDGNTLAAGAILESSDATGIDGAQDNDNLTHSGAVYVFTRSADSWSQQAYVKASNSGLQHNFGFSVALSDDGDILAVGAPGENGDAVGINGEQDNDNASNSGAAYLFSRSGGSWSQQAYVKASNTDPGDRFGFSVALVGGGDTLAVGAREEGSNATGIGGDQDFNYPFSGSGAVYLY